MHALPRHSLSFLTARGSVRCLLKEESGSGDMIGTSAVATQAATRTPLTAFDLTNPSLSTHPFSSPPSL